MTSCFMQEMGLLEVKHGLLQIAETLDFLHSNARLIHRSISPETILITSNGLGNLVVLVFHHISGSGS
ncbi:hypothetical protein HAX54_011750 [Datura stramonium]|uniref:Protein kinase domain-containing protein n=1 Tax=Datura stramonium TaxID=4076 RepID=A0ABS8TIJ4_DATST|nr:hypothetical protein [Datura stramonium]